MENFQSQKENFQTYSRLQKIFCCFFLNFIKFQENEHFFCAQQKGEKDYHVLYRRIHLVKKYYLLLKSNKNERSQE